MRTKRIRIRSRAALNEDLLKSARHVDRGRKISITKGDYFESISAVRNVLTPKRLELWQVIRDRKPGSISILAKLVDRNFKSVHQDVQLLAAVGIVELRETQGKRGRRQEPRSLADTLTLEVA
jgi:predicted transcriptional regulator